MLFSGSLTLSVTKIGNASFRHFELKVDSEAKFPLVYKSNKSRFKSRVPESTSRLTLNRGRLVRMVDQNGGKLERLKKILKKLRFMQFGQFFRKS